MRMCPYSYECAPTHMNVCPYSCECAPPRTSVPLIIQMRPYSYEYCASSRTNMPPIIRMCPDLYESAPTHINVFVLVQMCPHSYECTLIYQNIVSKQIILYFRDSQLLKGNPKVGCC